MNDEWVDTFRTIIHRYNCQRISVPFMAWFSEQNKKTAYTINDKGFLVLIDALFDQQTTQKKPLKTRNACFMQGRYRNHWNVMILHH